VKHLESRVSGRNNLPIYHQAWLPPRVKAVVMIAHGLGEHGGRYRHVAEGLVQDGYAVHAVDHRGHGKSGGRRTYVDRFQHAVDDLHQVIQVARKGHRRKPMFLIGHSMGGAISLRYAIQHQKELSGLVLSAPAVALDGAPPLLKPLCKLLSAFTPRLGLFGIDPAAVTRDPEMMASYENDPLNCHGRVPVRTLGELIGFLDGLPAQLPSLTLRLLVMHGSADKLAGPSGSRMVLDRVSSTDKTLKFYDGLYHEIFNELPQDRARVIADLRSWISERIPS